jgi:RimJ/RimL family protein N-acetyltransferase
MESPKEDLTFRQVFTLRDGARVLLRPLVPGDRQALLDFFLPVSAEERRFMRHNINNPDVVAAWADEVNYDKVFPILAIINDRIVGISTLHFNEGTARHRAELRIFLAKDFKRRGLGSKLIQAQIEIARKRNIHMLEVQVISDHVEVIKAMQRVGFKPVCTFEDYFMLPDGELRDVVHLMLRLHKVEDEF